MFASWQPSQGATTVNSADQIKAGRIEVHIKEVVITGRRKLHRLGGEKTGFVEEINRPSADADSKKLPEDEKWFMAPALKVRGGQLVMAAIGPQVRLSR